MHISLCYTHKIIHTIWVYLSECELLLFIAVVYLQNKQTNQTENICYVHIFVLLLLLLLVKIYSKTFYLSGLICFYYSHLYFSVHLFAKCVPLLLRPSHNWLCLTDDLCCLLVLWDSRVYLCVVIVYILYLH